MTDYRKLDVYREAKVLARDFFRVTQRLPPHLLWRLGAQLDDAAESITANLAEGSGRKNILHANTELIRYAHMSYGSACEVESRLGGLHDRELISDAEHSDLAGRIGKVKGMLLMLIRAWKRADRGRQGD